MKESACTAIAMYHRSKQGLRVCRPHTSLVGARPLWSAAADDRRNLSVSLWNANLRNMLGVVQGCMGTASTMRTFSAAVQLFFATTIFVGLQRQPEQPGQQRQPGRRHTRRSCPSSKDSRRRLAPKTALE